jgi:hypothetical protein
MILLNFSHPLSPANLQRLAELNGQPFTEVREVPTYFDHEQPFAGQAAALAGRAGLTPTEWQTRPLLVNLPAHSQVAAALLAEMEGRMGYLPRVVRLKPAAPGASDPFVVAEIIDLRQARDDARKRRFAEGPGDG